jgi:hypothetical protein
MTSLPKTSVSCTDGLNLSELAASRASDAVLAAYLSIAPDEWRGRHNSKDVEIVFPNPPRARKLFICCKTSRS